MCTQTHTNICLSAQTHTHAPMCLAEKTFVGVRSLACICRLVARGKFNSHMETGKTHTCRPKLCCRARDGVTRWRGTARCCLRRPGVRGAGTDASPPGETQVHGWGGWMGAGGGCESMTVSTRAAVGITSTTVLHTWENGQWAKKKKCI